MKNRIGLIVGVSLLSVMYGILLMLDDGAMTMKILSVAAWPVLMLICAIHAVRLSDRHFNAAMIARMVIAVCIGAVVFWASPWSGLSVLGSFAVNEAGVILLLYLMSWLSIFFMTLLLVLTLFVTAGLLVRVKAVYIIRWLLFLSAAALASMILTLFVMWLYGVLPANVGWVCDFLNGFTTMGSVGIAFYFTTTIFSRSWSLKEEA